LNQVSHATGTLGIGFFHKNRVYKGNSSEFTQFYEKAQKKNEDVPKHYRMRLLKGHKRVEEETSSRKENYKVLVEQGGKKSSKKFSQYDRQDTQRVKMCDTYNFDVSFGAQFTSFMCIKERHQLFLNYFQQRDTGIYLILRAVRTACGKL
jgi:hypothetical protein